MMAHAETFSFAAAGLIVASLIYVLIRQLWNLPLRSGRGYFLGVEVASDFYEGSGRRWLTRYRVMLVTVHAAIFGALAAILAIGRWQWIPVWTGGTAVLFTTSFIGFTMWVRGKARAAQPRLPAALSLERRRLSDYMWWPVDALSVAAVACSWWMLLRGGRPFHWSDALAMSWGVLGLIPGKVMVVRQGWPIPAERAEEHRRLQEASRRLSVRWLDAFGALLASVLFMLALAHAWPAARSEAPWLLFGVPLASAVLLVATVIKQGQVSASSRGLRPGGSWVPPSGRASMWNRSGLVWFAIWFGGFMILQFVVPAMVAG
jgi:hypothetical protein